ncbi:MAG: BMP family ABC transporter substrate-binding protein [Oscillospiraceae bacterium]|jgi:basic membrane protein A|nr:BMP family ABC transporter substrate-binding protein [Oscillospiraceae bacterium]
MNKFDLKGMIIIKIKVTILTLLAIPLAVSGCLFKTSKKQEELTSHENSSEKFKVVLITDGGSLNDNSFNQGAYEGLLQSRDKLGITVSAIESNNNDGAANVSKAIDQNSNIIYGIGFRLSESFSQAAKSNKQQQFVLIDFAYDSEQANIFTITFKDQESAFLIGVLSALKSKTGKVAFIGGMQCKVVDQFETGFKAGISLANKQYNKAVTVNAQYIGNFDDPTKAKDIAKKQQAEDCDIIYAVAGAAGMGALEAVKETENTWFMGVDKDQSSLAPEKILASSLKLVGKAVEHTTTELYNQTTSEKKGGNQTLGLKEDGVGIAMTSLVQEDIQKEVQDISEQIKKGEITVPQTPEELTTYLKII